MPAITTIKHRRGTAAQWTSANPILGAGEMGVETDTKKFKFGNGTTTWNLLGYGVGVNDPSGLTVTWTNVIDKPATFAPSSHASSHAADGSDVITLAQSQVTGLDTALAGKSDTGHTHAITDVTGLDTALSGKADTVHSHAITDVTGLDTALAGKAPTVHTHSIADITDYVPPVVSYSDTFMMMGA